MAKPNNIVRLLIRKVSDEEKLSRHDTKRLRENINNDVDAFIANGGTVQQVPGFESTQQRNW